MFFTRLSNYYLILTAILFLANTGNAQHQLNNTNRYYVEHFGEEEGLLQNSINNIFPDANDFLWIATEGGITRFNGNRFLNIPVRINAAVASFTRAKGFYTKGQDTMLAFSGANSQIAVIVKNNIIAIEKMQYSKFGMFFLNLHNTIAAPAYLTKNASDGSTIEKRWNISAGGYNGIQYNKDTFLVTLDDGFAVYDSKGLVNEVKVRGMIPGRTIYLQNRFLFLDDENFINYYSISGFQKRELLPIPSKHKLRIYSNSYANNFFCVADSVLYRVYITSSGKMQAQQILTNLQNPVDITVVYEKDINTIVTGTLRNGLYVYKKQFFSITDPLPDQQSDAFYGQQLFTDNQTILTGGNKLFRNDRYIGITKGGGTNSTFSSLKDSKGNYWYVFNNRVLRAKEIGVAPDTVIYYEGIPNILYEDRQHRIWFSSSQQFGYFENEKFTTLKLTGLKSITCIQQDTEGRYLIGTREGLFILNDIHDSSLKTIPELASFDIRFILPDANGQIWVCTYGQGIYLISKTGVVVFPESNGRLAYTHCIIEDDKGRFWIPTNNGLFVTAKQSLVAYAKNKNEIPFYYQFTKKNGLRTNEFNGGGQPPFLYLPNNDISLPSMQGLVRFNPNAINFNFSSSPILLDQIRLDSTELTEQDNFDVSGKISNVSFSLSSAFWGGYQNSVLEYQVVGERDLAVKNTWVPVDRSGEINLFSLSHGKYELVIRKRTGLKENEYIYKKISFHVLPKWYQTKVFYLFVIAGIILAIAGIFFWRRDYYKKATLKLKEKVDAATSELQLMNSTLEEKVKERTIAIQQAEIKFRTLVESSLVGVYIVQDNKYAYVNPKFEEIMGYDKDELIGVDTTLIIKEDQRDIVREKIRLRMSGEVENVHYEITGVKKDGTRCQLELFGGKTIYEGKPGIIGTLIDITARKTAEDLLIKEKNLSQSIINNLPGIFYIFDQEGVYQLWNKNVETISGFTVEEVSQMHPRNFIEEGMLEVMYQKIEQVFTLGYAEMEASFMSKDGIATPYYFNGISITYNNKLCLMGVGIDISERKKAEEETEHANYQLNERIKELTTLYKAGLILQREEKSIVLTLQNFVSILPPGWQYPDITAARITLGELEFCSPNFKPSKFSQNAIFTTGNETQGKIEIVYLEERKEEVEGPFLTEERNLINMLADMLRVYFTRREANEALQKSEANLHTIFDTTDTVYALMDLSFKIIAINQRCHSFIEKELNKKVRQHTNFIDFFPKARQEFISENLNTAIKGNPISYEASYPQEDGKLNWYYVRMLPITGADKVVYGLMMAATDITEKKSMEQKIIMQKVQEQKKVTRAILVGEERERNKIGQELHDNVNQILAGTKLYLSMAEKGKKGTENIISESVALIDSAIKEIRNLSKEKVTPIKKINLEELIQTLVANFSTATKIKVSFTYTGSAHTIEDDLKLTIYRIIQEQLNNVLKHANAKKMSITIESSKENLKLTTADDGDGFDPAQKRNGIGLSNIINRVEAFNGTIIIDSIPGNGCKTSINIPL
ncbi:MAG: PAS domain S-box protein [Chitinophagaceae bacterium]